MTLNDQWDYMVKHEIVTERELKIATYLDGYSDSTMSDLLYIMTGYRDIEQYMEEMENECN